jgi:hypothetical protein
MDLISRQAAIEAVHKSIFDFFDVCDDDEESPMTYKDELLLEVNKAITTQIKAVVSAQPIEAEPFKAFAHWVASEVCNEGFEDMWSLGAFAEVACRKLYALGIVQKFRDEWVYVDKDELDGGENG